MRFACACLLALAVVQAAAVTAGTARADVWCYVDCEDENWEKIRTAHCGDYGSGEFGWFCHCNGSFAQGCAAGCMGGAGQQDLCVW